MLKKFAGFHNLQWLGQSPRTVIYSGTLDADQSNAILKMPKADIPTPSDVSIFQTENEILGKISGPGVPKVRHFENQGRNLYLILTSLGGTSLDKIIANGPLTIEKFFEVADKILAVVGEIHLHQIIHRDLKPQNITYRHESNEVEIIDFGLAIPFSARAGQAQAVVGTLEYLAPEQTGRINRHVDFRSDLYSLGITFFEMLTGALPFRGKDELELIHAQVAMAPPDLKVINANVPELLARIIDKLLKKSPEDRYQTAEGLRHDLHQCALRARANTPGDFTLGSADQSKEFIIPEKVYGREKQLQILTASYQSTMHGKPRFVMIDGVAGIGKSTLVKELTPLLLRESGIVLSGKFEQYHRNVPLAAFVQAINGFVRQALTWPTEEIEHLRAGILKEAGGDCALLAALAPQMTKIVGAQEQNVELGADEIRARLMEAVLALFAAITKTGRPLILFVDDLQWSDGASRMLLENILISRSLPKVFVIGAQRDQERDALDPWPEFSKKLVMAGVAIDSIELSPLTVEDTAQIVADTLHCLIGKALPLARLIAKKTEGNPFYILQFLQMLYGKGHLKYELGWTWDNAEIERLEATTNVLDLLIDKINSMNPHARRILCVAACISSGTFRIEDIVNTENVEPLHVVNGLNQALSLGLVAKFDDLAYRFVHDRIHEAAHLLLPKEEQIAVHFKYGHYLLKDKSEAELGEVIFSVVSHLNIARSLVRNEQGRVQLAELNAVAVERARLSTSNESILLYSNEGLEALNGEDWMRHEKLLYTLYLGKAEALSLLGNFAASDAAIGHAFRYLRTRELKLNAYNVHLEILETSARSDEILPKAIEALALLKIKIPRKRKLATLWNIFAILLEFKIRGLDFAFRVKKAAPNVTDDLLNHAVLGAIGNKDDLIYFDLIVFRRALRHGFTETAGFVTAAMATVFFTELKMPQLGRKLVELTRSWDSRVSHTFSKGWAQTTLGAYVIPWAGTYREALNSLSEGWLLAQENRFKTFLHQVNLGYQVYYTTLTGEPLGKVRETILKLGKPIADLRADNLIFRWNDALDFIAKLSGEKAAELPASDEAIEQLPSFLYRESTKGWRGAFHLWAQYVLGDYEKALLSAEKVALYRRRIGNVGYAMNLYFIYHPLTLCALYDSVDQRTRAKYLRQIKMGLKQLRWLSGNSSSFVPACHLVEGELARIDGRMAEAALHFNRAIESAAGTGLVYLEAAAHELMAGLHLRSNLRSAVRFHLGEALNLYRLWQAHAKVKQMVAAHSDVLQTQSLGNERISNSLNSADLDIASIMKSSNALAEEIEMQQLIAKLIWIMIENAGAERGALIVGGSVETLRVAAIANVARLGEAGLVDLPVSEAVDLPQSVISLVARSGEPVILANAQKDEVFSSDPHLRSRSVLSVICLPIINKGQFHGLIYLEQNSAPGVFDSGKVKLLNILIGQAAISLENARLYQQAGEKARMEAELVTARAVQETLFPPSQGAFKNASIYGHYEPATECGGDLWHYNTIGGNSYFWIGDAIGHGAPAALLTSAARATIAVLRKFPQMSPLRSLEILNETIRECSKGLQHMTFAVLAVDPNRKLSLSCAGHPPPIHIGRDLVAEIRKTDLQDAEAIAKIRKLIKPFPLGATPPLGQDDAVEFAQIERQAEPGDLIVMYSDGITEMHNSDEKEWGDRQFINALIGAIKNATTPSGIVDFTIAEAKRYRADCELQDDATLIVVAIQ